MNRKAGWIIAAACLLLSGCVTTYHVTRPDGTELSVMSTRSFEGGIKVDYESAEGAKLKIEAGKVTQPDLASQLTPILGTAVELLKAKAVTPP